MRGIRHVGSDTAVSAVHATTHLRSTLSSEMINKQTVQVKLLALSIGLSVLKEGQKNLAALLRPATLSAVLLKTNKKKKKDNSENRYTQKKTKLHSNVCVGDFTEKRKTVKKKTNLPLMALSLATDLASEATEGDDLPLVDNVVEVLLGADEGHTLDSSADLTHVLEVGAHVHSASPGDHANVPGEVGVMVCHRPNTNTQNKNKQKNTNKKRLNKKN